MFIAVSQNFEDLGVIDLLHQREVISEIRLNFAPFSEYVNKAAEFTAPNGR